MAKGDPLPSPLDYYNAGDYLGRRVSIVINWNTTTRALISAIVHRDTGCLYNKIILDNPSDAQKAKPLALPVDGAGDRTYTSTQLSAQNLNTIDDILTVQITASP